MCFALSGVICMMNKLLVAALCLGGLAVHADTVTMRDGSRHSGVFLSGSSGSITLIDQDGDRRQFDRSQVVEIAFGNAASTATEQERSRTTAPVNRQSELLSRLRDDLTFAMQQSSLAARQRDILQDARDTLSAAIDDTEAGRTVNARSVRLALDNIRYVASSTGFRAADRRTLLDAINELRHHSSEFGRPTTPTRTRRR